MGHPLSDIENHIPVNYCGPFAAPARRRPVILDGMTSTPPPAVPVPRLASTGDLADRQRAVLRLIAEAESEKKKMQ